ncbi:hypothetical protein BDN72DRAFT_899961 [Pluteus cervinus]|uniref:Uncharacterized protein n=1 Tax=Pluteus cervinus TaxID=181527 RepID=A0ACD3ALE7_9AGAR|nr:hypothetical protein BDN72DRAFT_899961 [Pluteus cervinus]
MDRISQNKEILHDIIRDTLTFGLLGLTTSCILVCKSWSDVAFDILWRTVHTRDFYRLFKILCPLKKVQKSANGITLYRFHRDVTTADWTRFARYSRRVRVLELTPINSLNFWELKQLDQSVYDALAVSRPESGIFPNITELELDTRLGYCAPLFLHSGVKTLRIALYYPTNEGEPESPLNDRQDLLHHASLKMSGLHEISLGIAPSLMGNLHWGTGYTIYQDEKLICQLLRQQSQLRTFSLPWCWFTTRIAEAVAFLPDLKSILPVSSGAGLGNPLDTLTFNPVLVHGVVSSAPFPLIQELFLAIPYPQFRRFLLQWIPSGHAHSSMQVLTIHSQVLESPGTMRGMLDSLVPRCPNLTSLTIKSLCSSVQMPWTNDLPYQCYPGQDDTTRPSPSEWTLECLDPFRVTINTISSLFSLNHLKCLDLHHHIPAAFSSADLENIASNFSQLTSLDLFSDPHPIYLGGANGNPSNRNRYDEIVVDRAGHRAKRIPEFTHTLRTFGSKCPNLRTLGVFVCPHPKNAAIEDEFPDTSPPVDYFPNLQELSFGSSFFRNSMSGSLALVLGEYLGPSAKISASCSWGGGESTGIDDNDYTERLRRGGRIPPDPLQVGITSVDKITDSPEEPKSNHRFNEAWRSGVNGEPIPPDQAVLTSATGDPLIFDVSMFLEDTAMQGTMACITETPNGEKWMPGVGFGGGDDDTIAKELKARRMGWRNVAGMMPSMRTIRLQEKQLLERRLKAVGNNEVEN